MEQEKEMGLGGGEKKRHYASDMMRISNRIICAVTIKPYSIDEFLSPGFGS